MSPYGCVLKHYQLATFKVRQYPGLMLFLGALHTGCYFVRYERASPQIEKKGQSASEFGLSIIVSIRLSHGRSYRVGVVFNLSYDLRHWNSSLSLTV